MAEGFSNHYGVGFVNKGGSAVVSFVGGGQLNVVVVVVKV